MDQLFALVPWDTIDHAFGVLSAVALFMMWTVRREIRERSPSRQEQSAMRTEILESVDAAQVRSSADMNHTVSGIRVQMDGVDGRLHALERKVIHDYNNLLQRFAAQDVYLEKIGGRLEVGNQRMDGIEAAATRIERSLDRIQDHIVQREGK